MRCLSFGLTALLAVPFAAWLTGCSTAGTVPSDGGGGGHTILASSYDQSCSAASDCTLVAQGDVCGCIGCPGAAVNKSAAAQFQADFQSLQKQCSGPPPACPALCIYSETTCIGMTCGACHSPGCSEGGVPMDSGTHD